MPPTDKAGYKYTGLSSCSKEAEAKKSDTKGEQANSTASISKRSEREGQ